MANTIYTSFAYDLLTGKIKFPSSSDTTPVFNTSVMLLQTYNSSSGHENHKTIADIMAATSPANVVASGNRLNVEAWVLPGENSIKIKNNSPLTWASSTITAVGAVFYYGDTDQVNNATQKLICYMDFNGSKSSAGGNFTIQFDSRGLFQLNF